MTEEMEELLHAAKVPLCSGMRALDESTHVAYVITDEEGRLVRGTSLHGEICYFRKAGHAEGVDAFPDLDDPATFALCLAELARRVGLDPSRGATWSYSNDGTWSVHDGISASGRCLDLETDYPILALALALKATAKEAE